jgi:hypothetical protein
MTDAAAPTRLCQWSPFLQGSILFAVLYPYTPHQPLAVRTNKSGRRRDISEHQDLESPRQLRRGGRQEYIYVEHDGTDSIEDDSAIQAFADSLGLASSDTAVLSISDIWF